MEQLLAQDVRVIESQSRSAICILLRTESGTKSASVAPDSEVFESVRGVLRLPGDESLSVMCELW